MKTKLLNKIGLVLGLVLALASVITRSAAASSSSSGYPNYRLIDLGLISHPASPALIGLRHRALGGLRARHQQLNPFKFIVYSEWAKAELSPVE